MSDIGNIFPWWFSLLALTWMFWPVTLALFVVCLGAGLYLQGTPRLVLLIVAGLLGASLVSLAVMQVQKIGEDKQRDDLYARLNVTLTENKTIAGIKFPAGTAIVWKDDSFSDIAQADLPAPTRIFGVTLQDRLDHADSASWQGTLSTNTVIEDWPCVAGLVSLSATGPLMACTLSSDHKWKGLLVPAKTDLTLKPPQGVAMIVLPSDRTMELPQIGTLPGGTVIAFNAEGSIESAYMNAATAPLIARGVPLYQEVQWIYGKQKIANALQGVSAEDVSCQGQTIAADKRVSISLLKNELTIRRGLGDADSVPETILRGCLK